MKTITNITVEHLFKKYKKTNAFIYRQKTQKLYFVFELNNAGFEETLKFCLNREVTHLPS
jgi:hypothetical protein